MITRKWSKQNVQEVLKSLRSAKTKEGKNIFNVVKKDNLYEVKANKDNELVFEGELILIKLVLRFKISLI